MPFEEPHPREAAVESTEANLVEHVEWLSRLSRSLVQDAEDREDAVQDAWLAALRRSPRPGPGMRAWLKRVFLRHLAHARVRGSRRKARESAAGQPEALPSVHEIAERLELELQLGQAVAGLPEVQRVAVWMRYWEHLPPRTIAERLGVPVETVRTRLKRALAALRSTLERTRGSDWKSAFMPLAGVHYSLSSPVLSTTGFAGIALGTGAIALKTKLCIAAGIAACVALMGAWYASPTWLSEVPEELRSEHAQRDASAELGSFSHVERVRDEMPNPTVAAEVPSLLAQPATAVIRGRLLSASDREPLDNVRIALRGSARDRRLPARSKWVDPDTATSDPNGRFEITFDPPEDMQFDIRLSAERRTPKRGFWGKIKPGQVIDIGDVEMFAGYEVSGRVIDENGVGIARATVEVRGLPIELKDHLGMSDHISVSSQEDGVFKFGAEVPVGTWVIEANAAGWRQLMPLRAEVANHGASSSIAILMRRKKEITGIVVDEVGAPVEGVLLAAGPLTLSSNRTPRSTSRADGNFVLYAEVDDPSPTRIVVVAAGRCEPPEVPDVTEHPWGTSGLRIVLRRARTVELLVVEAGSNTPVLDYAVQYFGDREKNNTWRALLFGGQHVGGRLVLDPVLRGTNHLVVHPIDRALLPSEDLVFEVGEEPIQPLRVEVERMPSFHIHTVTREGSALEGAKVEVIALGSTKLEQEQPVASRFDTSPTYVNGSVNADHHRLLSVAHTDAEGSAEVFAMLPPQRIAVRVTHPEVRPLFMESVAFELDRELVLILSRGASIHGRVQAPGLDFERLSVTATRKDISRSERGFRVTARIEPDGRFALLGLTAGLHDVQLDYRVPFRDESSAGWHSVNLVGAGAEVALAEDGAGELLIDASAHAPGRLRARVVCSNRAITLGSVVLAKPRGPTCGAYPLDAEGRFEVDELLPGTYRPILRLPQENGAPDIELRGEATFVIAPATTAEHELHFVHRRLAVRILERDGKTPFGGEKVRWDTTEALGIVTTDAQGWFVIDPAPPEPLDLALFPSVSGQMIRESLGSVFIPLGQTRAEISVTRGGD